MIIDKNISETNSLSNINKKQLADTMDQLENHSSNNSPPIYRSHIQKRHIDLGRYYDGMMRATSSQLPTHDLRFSLALNRKNTKVPSEGVNEETVRQGRILLDSIPDSIDVNKQTKENAHTQ